MGGNRVLEYSGKVIDKSANGNSLVAEATGRSLSDDRIADRSDGNHVDQGGNDEQNTNSELGFSTAHPTKATNGNKTEEHKGKARHVNGGTTIVREEEPTYDTANDIAR